MASHKPITVTLTSVWRVDPPRPKKWTFGWAEIERHRAVTDNMGFAIFPKRVPKVSHRHHTDIPTEAPQKTPCLSTTIAMPARQSPIKFKMSTKTWEKNNKKSRRIREGMSILSAVPQKRISFFTNNIWLNIPTAPSQTSHIESHTLLTIHPHSGHIIDTIQTLCSRAWHTPTTGSSVSNKSTLINKFVVGLSQIHQHFPLCDWMQRMQRASGCFHHSLQIRSRLFHHTDRFDLAFVGCVFLSICCHSTGKCRLQRHRL